MLILGAGAGGGALCLFRKIPVIGGQALGNLLPRKHALLLLMRGAKIVPFLRLLFNQGLPGFVIGFPGRSQMLVFSGRVGVLLVELDLGGGEFPFHWVRRLADSFPFFGVLLLRQFEGCLPRIRVEFPAPGPVFPALGVMGLTHRLRGRAFVRCTSFGAPDAAPRVIRAVRAPRGSGDVDRQESGSTLPARDRAP